MCTSLHTYTQFSSLFFQVTTKDMQTPSPSSQKWPSWHGRCTMCWKYKDRRKISHHIISRLGAAGVYRGVLGTQKFNFLQKWPKHLFFLQKCIGFKMSRWKMYRIENVQMEDIQVWKFPYGRCIGFKMSWWKISRFEIFQMEDIHVWNFPDGRYPGLKFSRWKISRF